MKELPEFFLTDEDLYTIVYTIPEDKNLDCSGSPKLQDEADGDSSSTVPYKGGRQPTASGDCESRRARASSSSSSCYESAIEEQLEKESQGFNDATSEVPSSPCRYTRGVQAVPETSDAETQMDVLDTSVFVELQSTPKIGVDIMLTRQRFENLIQKQVGDVEPLEMKQARKVPQASTSQQVVKSKNCMAVKEQKAFDKNRAGDKGSLRPPRLPLRKRNLSSTLRPPNKLLVPPVEPRPRSLKQADQEFSRAAKQLTQPNEVPHSTKPVHQTTEPENKWSSKKQRAKISAEKQ
ncbi:hypothetical protein MRX96_016539 [Rhipicephalus microplus]